MYVNRNDADITFLTLSSHNRIAIFEGENRFTRPASVPLKSLESYGRGLAILEKLVTTHPDVPDYRLDLATTFNNIGTELSGAGRNAEALKSHSRSSGIMEALVSARPAVTRFQFLPMAGYANIGGLHREMGNFAEALESFRRSQAINDRLGTAYPNIRKYQALRVGDRREIGLLLAKIGDKAGARESFRQALALAKDLARSIPADASNQDEYASALDEIGRIGLAAGQITEAIPALRQAISIRQRIAQSPVGLYNLACGQSLLAGVASRPEAGLSADEARAEGDAAVATLGRAMEMGYRDLAPMRVDTDLDPLRPRPDFQALMLDLAFPAKPFAP